VDTIGLHSYIGLSDGAIPAPRNYFPTSNESGDTGDFMKKIKKSGKNAEGR
jgi:hypothetical protein